MSKRAIYSSIFGFLILGIAGLVLFRTNLPFLPFGDPVFTEEIPESRPKRLDRRLMARFEGKPIQEILAVLSAEQAIQSNPTPEAPPENSEQRLLQSLPDAPLPFPEDAEPRDAKWLREFATSRKQEEETKPTEEELWRFNLALAALKISPDQLPEALRQNTIPKSESDTLDVGLSHRPESLSGQFTIGNFDSEPDLEIIDQGGLRMNKLSASGALIPVEGALASFPGNRLYPADFDADGDLDLYLIRGNGLPDSLLRNTGEGRFEDVTIEAGLLAFRDSTSAAWLDYDSDGHLDLLVGSKDQPLELYHQTESGTFQAVAWDLKLWVPRGIRSIEVADVSGDGALDIYLGIDGISDRLCVNRPAASWSDWRFSDSIAEANLNDLKNGSVRFFDINNDGLHDLLFLDQEGALALYRNEGELSFRNVTSDCDLPEISGASAIGVLDLDNDGFQDLMIGTGVLQMNRLFWNRGGVFFREISVASGGAFLDQPIAFDSGDVDQNGATDLFYLNDSGEVRRLESEGTLDSWLLVKLKNHLPGLRLSVQVRDSDWVVHTIDRVTGIDSMMRVGLGEAEVVESLAIFAPNGEKPLHSLTKIDPNQEVTIELPKRPKTRAVVPMNEGAAPGAPKDS